MRIPPLPGRMHQGAPPFLPFSAWKRRAILLENHSASVANPSPNKFVAEDSYPFFSVNPPPPPPTHHAASTWRDFYIHITTIVLGLLIAIGLEQTVEWMHHRHQLHQLEADLHTEGIRNLHIALDNIHGSELRRDADANQYAE